MYQLPLIALLIFMLSGCTQQQKKSSKRVEPIETEILRITPSGEDIAPPSQIVITFKDDVVPLGKMDREPDDINITITPPLPCQWRWLSRSSLSCQLSKDAAEPKTDYEVILHKKLVHSDNITLKQEYQHHFSTTVPKVRYVTHEVWMQPDLPYLHVYFNMPVSHNAVERSFYFELKNSKSIPAIVLKKEITQQGDQQITTYTSKNITANEKLKEWIIAPKEPLGENQQALVLLKSGFFISTQKQTDTKEHVLEEIYTFEKFKFLGFKCSKKSGSDRCDPMQSIGLTFSAPVLTSNLKKALKLSPPLNRGLKDFDPWANRYDYSQLTYPHYANDNYTLWLPRGLKAFEEYNLTLDSDLLNDEFGRSLAHDINITFKTAHREPVLKVPHSNAVLEKGIQSDIPLYATNIDTINLDYTMLKADGTFKSVSDTIPTQKVRDISYRLKMGIRDIFKGDSGLFFGTISTPDIKKYYPKTLFAQITPFEVHTKLGHFSSLVWITDFQSAQPVTGAKVTLCSGYFDQLNQLKELPFKGVTDHDGLVLLPGTQEIDKKLKTLGWRYRYDKRYFIKVEKGSDIALLPLDNSFKIHSSDVYSYMHRYGEHAKAWGTTAQGVYKLGDTVEYKIFVRDQNNTSLTSPNRQGFTLKVFDPLNKLIYERDDLNLSDYGTFSGSFMLSKEGAVGRYQFDLQQTQRLNGDTFEYYWNPMSIVVSDFTPASFSVTTEVNATHFKDGDSVGIYSRASMFSGGPYAHAKLRITGNLIEKSFSSNHPLAKEFDFGGSDGREIELFNLEEELDAKGEHLSRYRLQNATLTYADLLFESSIMDERGKYIASRTKATFSGVDRFVGIKEHQWVYNTDENSSFELLAVDTKGTPLKGVEITVDIEHQQYRASRVKGAGNAFITKSSSKWIKEHHATLISKDDAPVVCHFVPKSVGRYRFITSLKDSKGRTHSVTIYSYVSGYGTTLWNSNNDSTLKIVPQKNSYNVGETAKYLVKNPYAKAKALITIERYGILDSWAEEFTTNTPIIEVPIKPEYLPGFYLSVIVVSPRVAKPLGEGIVDLGKPSYKMGYVRTMVKEGDRELAIDIATDKKIYAPQEEVNLSIHVDPEAKHPKRAYELAIVVIDRSLYALNTKGSSYYDPYRGFHQLDNLDVTNFNLISRLIGRQKFEKKGANQGGDGGSTTTPASLRDDFKYIAYYNADLLTDKEGIANVSFKVPDNLTGWDVVVMAVNKDELMGSAKAEFVTNRSTEIRPVMPNQLLRGDRFSAGFNILNRTDKKRNIEVDIEVSGSDSRFKKFSLSLKPFERRTLYLNVEAKRAGVLHFKATAHDALDTDSIVHTIEVKKRSSLETMANFGSTQERNISETIAVPSDIIPDVGSISVVLSPTVIGSIKGAFSYIRDYPYLCWEQRLTKAVAATQYNALQEYLPPSLQWEHSRELPSQMLNDATNFQAPNGGMAFWKAENEYVSPYLSVYTALAFEWLKEDGYDIGRSVERQLHHYISSVLKNDKPAKYYNTAMSNTVKAVALNALARAKKIGSDEIERYFRHYSDMTLFGKAHYLQAMMQVDNLQKGMKKKVLDNILSTAIYSAGKVSFNEPFESSNAYLLATPMRANCSILSTLVMAQQDDELKNSVGDLAPKLLRSITKQREGRDYWENTQENIFCMNAISKYAKFYESQDTDMKVTVHYDTKEMGQVMFHSKKESPQTLAKEINASDVGTEHTVSISKEGHGRLYYTSRISYAPKQANTKRINSGMEIRREYSIKRNNGYELLKSPIQLKKGDIVRIDLFISLPTTRHFVVVNDPIPGGLEAINSALATTSLYDTKEGEFEAAKDSWWFQISSWSSYGYYGWSFYHKELRDASARFYADTLPAGSYHLSYTAQAIAEGHFSVMSADVLEMYDPDIYGKSLPMQLNISH